MRRLLSQMRNSIRNPLNNPSLVLLMNNIGRSIIKRDLVLLLNGRLHAASDSLSGWAHQPQHCRLKKAAKKRNDRCAALYNNGKRRRRVDSGARCSISAVYPSTSVAAIILWGTSGSVYIVALITDGQQGAEEGQSTLPLSFQLWFFVM